MAKLEKNYTSENLTVIMNHIYAFCISFTSCENICVHLAQ